MQRKKVCRAEFEGDGRFMLLVVEKEVAGAQEQATLTMWVNGVLDWNDVGTSTEMFEQAVDFMKQHNMKILPH